MQIYLVGGAVRDSLLGFPIKEHDWVVIGVTPQEMLTFGFQPVGKDFPVFLHPVTHEEYALARTERKTGPGYQGFAFYAAPEVTLEQDLQRRDLTINAMAEAPDGQIIDPFHGRRDLHDRILRHVSTAFVEDPVRILRIARFSARFVDFSIHPETLSLMKTMTQNGEVDALVAERVWQELERAMGELAPQRFFTVLLQCGALAILFSELLEYLQAALLRLEKAAKLSTSSLIRFAVFLSCFSESVIQVCCSRYKAPAEFRDLALLVARYYGDYQQSDKKNPTELLELLEALDAFRRNKRFELFLLSCAIISQDPLFVLSKTVQRLRAVYKVAVAVDTAPFIAAGLTGKAIGQALKEQRVRAIQQSLGN